jgi:ribosome-binding factor A
MSRSPKRSAPPSRRASIPEAGRRTPAGPTQRQLRAGELVRHALVELLREEDLADPALAEVSITLTEVRMSPDLRHALCFVTPLGGAHVSEVVSALNRATRFFRGRLGRMVDLKFTPDLKFVPDDSFEEAERMARLFADPKIRRDLEAPDDEEGPKGDDGA